MKTHIFQKAPLDNFSTRPRSISSPKGQKILPPDYGFSFADKSFQPIQTIAENGEQSLSKASFHGKANNTGLPDNLKAGVENLSGITIDDVKVHYNSSKPAQLNALAYAQGNNIYLGPGQDKHLSHEAWHIVQQRQGRVKPTAHIQGLPVNDNPSLEREANVMGAKAENTNTVSQLQSVSINGLQEAVHTNKCGCASCSGTAQTKKESVSKPLPLKTISGYSSPIAQLTCDAGHKQHKKGPCPNTAAGKVARMASKHHQKTGKKGTPKARSEKWEEERLQKAKDRMGES